MCRVLTYSGSVGPNLVVVEVDLSDGRIKAVCQHLSTTVEWVSVTMETAEETELQLSEVHVV